MFKRFKQAITRKGTLEQLATLRSQVDDAPGWTSISGQRHDRDWAEIQELYSDTLLAWRKNPIAWRIIAITTDYVTGGCLTISSPLVSLNQYIHDFWNHPNNRLDLRLASMVEELSRAGDLFVLLFRNRLDGMSYLRFITKDQVAGIESLENDWETEIAYLVHQPGQAEPQRWLGPAHPQAAEQDALMLHYAVNRPIGALLGESDLAALIPWLLRYSRMLEDRVRLHWAARSFLYLVTVPPNKIESKSAQYAAAPESGSIIVKDESEKWETLTPALRGADAAHDMKAVRQMIDAGSGYPPHWRGEGGDVNLATAEAMQAPPEKHLARRQAYFAYILQDILFHAYQQAVALGKAPPLPNDDYSTLFTIHMPDVSSRDNLQLAQAAQHMAAAMQTLSQGLQNEPDEALKQLMRAQVLRASGETEKTA